MDRRSFEKMARRLTGRPTELDKLVDQYAKHGMDILPVGNLGRPAGLRQKLGINPDDFVVCGFMASSPGKIPLNREIARLYPETLGRIDNDHKLNIIAASGGGNWKGEAPTDATGIMGQWAYGATRNDRTPRFVTQQGLLFTEGLPRAKGKAVCIKQDAADSLDARLGLRTDGLIYIGDFFPVFPGGFGTDTELKQFFTNLGIADFARKKALLIDPTVANPATGVVSNYWQNCLAFMIEQHQFGYIRDLNASAVNDNCLVYRPDPRLSPEQIVREMIAITLATRDAANQYDPEASYKRVPSDVLRQYLEPLAANSSLTHAFTNMPLQDRSWGDGMQYLSAHHKRETNHPNNATRPNGSTSSYLPVDREAGQAAPRVM